MHTRRSQTEAIKREADRVALSKRVAVALPHNTFAARIIEAPSKRIANKKKDEDKKKEEWPEGEHADYAFRRGAKQSPGAVELMRKAIHFAAGQLKDDGLHGIELAPGEINIQEEVSGVRMGHIISAAVVLKASSKVALNQRIASKGFELNLSFANGKFSLDSIQRNAQLFPINKASLTKVLAMEDPMEDEESEKDSKEDADKKKAQSSGKYIVWIKENKGDGWEEQGDGPLSKGTADRISKEIRSMCAAVQVLPVGTDPVGEKKIAQAQPHNPFQDGATPQRTQSIPNGTRVRFNMKDIGPEEFGADAGDLDVAKYDGQIGTISTLATATEEGEKDFEYYDVSFPDGKLEAISGYHLTPV